MKYDRIRLLLVDGSPGGARLVRELLRQVDAFPFELAHVETLHAALEHLHRHGTDVAILDLALSDGDGLETLREMLAAAPEVPVVALAGRGDGDQAMAAVRGGAQDCLGKDDVTGRLLARSLRHAVERARRERGRRTALERERRARRSAEDAVHARDEVLAIVAHDLRNPLGAITNTAAVLLAGSRDAEQTAARLHVVQRSARQMDRLIQDLLDVSDLRSGTLRIAVRPADVSAIVEDARATMEAQAEQAGVDLTCEVETDVPDVLADHGRTLQVLSNLLGNAVRFTPPGGVIVVRAGAFGDAVLFTVSDTGAGIPSDELPRLFDSRWQFEHSRHGGTGRGLAISRGIVEALGGRLWAASEQGEGSTFFFTLPQAGGPRRPDEEPESIAAPRTVDDRPLRVLVVDDHAAIRHGIAVILGKAGGVEVAGEAASGVEALARARRLRPDIVLMDLVMPGIDGVEATRRLIAEMPSVRVLALTAEADDEALIRVLEAGGSGVVRKTTAHEDVVRALTAVARDGIFLYPSGNRVLLRDVLRRSEPESGPLAGLTRRERQLLRLTAEGFTSREIARKLYLSPNTVDSYRSRLMRRLGVGHRSALVRLALSTGLLSAE